MRVTIKIKFGFQNSNSLSSIKIVFEESQQLLLFNDSIFFLMLQGCCYGVPRSPAAIGISIL